MATNVAFADDSLAGVWTWFVTLSNTLSRTHVVSSESGDAGWDQF